MSWLFVAAFVVGTLGVAPGRALAAGPEWAISVKQHNAYGAQGGVDPETGSGETFARESGSNKYTITIANNGSGPTEGPAIFRDKLPEGMVLVGIESQGLHAIAHGPEFECKVISGGREAECSTTTALAGKKQYEPITLNVHVKPEAASVSENEAKMSGGKAGEKSVITHTTVTNAVPFGIHTFNVESCAETASRRCEEGEWLLAPFNQAGGHPFAFTTELIMNYTPADEENALAGAGGGAKEVQVELPPGFLGNPLYAPRCSLEGFGSHQPCPENSAIGFVAISLGGGIEKGGRARAAPEPLTFREINRQVSALVYNLEPTPGHVVALGFNILEASPGTGTPIVLEGSLRSDGDYGVTVGSITPSLPRLLSVRLTTCENGAQKHVLSATVQSFACNPAPAGSKPFLTAPTGCAPAEPGASVAPMMTAVANAWDEPADHSSKTVATNAEEGVLGASSLLTGCDSVQFRPDTSLNFRPSEPAESGSTQADEPTGMTLDLRMPQTNEASVKAAPEIKNLKMKLPAGMTVSPSAADGLQACSDAQFGLGTEFGPGSAHSEPAKPASCPLSSQVATVEVFTPLLSGAPTIEGVRGKPTIEGVRGKGGALTCSPGMWSGGAELTYQWLRGGEAIKEEGASGNVFPAKYTLKEADEHKAIQCQVTATSPGGRSVAVSRDVVIPPEASPVPPFPPPSIAAPSGSASVGNALSCSAGAWTSSTVKSAAAAATPVFKYAWLRGGTVIAGATAPSYTLAPEDAGKVIQCGVTGENAGGAASNAGGLVIADSAAVVAEPVPSPPPVLPGAPLQGQLFVGQPECSPCTNQDAEDGKLFRLFLQIQDPRDGLIVKLHGINKADPLTGQLESEFLDQPQTPFELLKLKLKSGPRAPVANAQGCGPAVTVADVTPWSAPGLGGLTGKEAIPGTPDATLSSQYTVDANGAGGACPSAWPFKPSFNAGTTGPAATTAGAFTQFALTFAREDREQDLSGLEVHLPLGLVGKIAAIKQCGEAEIQAAEADQGECPAESQIGKATAGAGPGPHPFFPEKEGKVYLTGPYKGGPFGLAVVTPAVAGPFNLGNIVVRAAIMIDPNTAAVTTISDPLPQFRDGVQLRLRKAYVEVNNPNFMINPTNCNAQQVSATITSAQGASAQVSSPFGIGGCASLPFHPEFTAEVGGHGSKPNGTTFIVKVKATRGEANIRKTFLQLPIALPSRLTTIQKACLAATFEANPATCGEGSNIGFAVAHTPLLKNPLVGPAYLVSHGNAAFPDVEFVLQGEGITLILDGKTDIKKGITYSRFETVPDAPVSTFETVLPAGPHSALTTNVPESENFSLCKQPPLLMPTEITGQNGAVLRQTTHITLLGCAPTVKIAKVRVSGNAVVVTVTTSAMGTVRISGSGLKTTSKALAAGTHQVRVPLTKNGRTMRKHHRKTTVHVGLTVGKQAVTEATSVRL